MNYSQSNKVTQQHHLVQFMNDAIPSGIPGLQQKGATLHIMSNQQEVTVLTTLSSTTEEEEPDTKPDGRNIPDETKPDGRNIPDETKPDGRNIPDKKETS